MTFLDDATVDDVRRLVASGGHGQLMGVALHGVDLGPVAELACAMPQWQENGNQAVIGTVQTWASTTPTLARALDCVRGLGGIQVDRHASPRLEIDPVDSVLLEDLPFLCERFKRSLVNHGGFSKSLADALGGSLGEMTDNVFRHSTEDEGRASPGVVAFAVDGPQFEFTVADVGRGALASLRSIPDWQDLTSAKMALDAIVMRRATRRSRQTEGGGFRDLFTALVDLEGRLRLRCGDAAMTLEGKGNPTHRLKVHSAIIPLAGFQITVRGRR